MCESVSLLRRSACCANIGSHENVNTLSPHQYILRVVWPDTFYTFHSSSHSPNSLHRWQVLWDKQGIEVTQLATLDTLSSHILSLSSSTLINHEPTPDHSMQHIFFNSPGKKSLNHTTSRADVAPVLTTPRVTHTQMVVACTNLGELSCCVCLLIVTPFPVFFILTSFLPFSLSLQALCMCGAFTHMSSRVSELSGGMWL